MAGHVAAQAPKKGLLSQVCRIVWNVLCTVFHMQTLLTRPWWVCAVCGHAMWRILRAALAERSTTAANAHVADILRIMAAI